ncbi:MAG: hypothetical protein PVI81_04995 [Anaerolineales bacterium]|jgi:hypothetical protein
MKTSEHQLIGVFKILCHEVETLGRFYEIVKQMARERSHPSDVVAQSPGAICESAWRALLIGLAGVLSTDQESITLTYLLDLASNHPHFFRFSEQNSLMQVVDRSRTKLRELDEVELKLRLERDRRLAHLDRKLINEPDSFEENRIQLEEALDVLKITEQIVSTLYSYFHGEPIEFLDMREEYGKQLDRMFS